MPTCAQWQEWLDQALAARANLLSGGAVTSIQSAGGKRIDFNAANTRDLDAWITRLQTEVDRCNGTAYGRRAFTLFPIDR